MRQSAVKQSIVRHTGGHIVYYPWTWRSIGATTAYVVDSSNIIRDAVRRKRIGTWLLSPWVVASLLLMRFNPVLLISLDLILAWGFARWVAKSLRNTAVKLPRRFALGLAATQYDEDELEIEFLQIAMMAGMMLVVLLLLFFRGMKFAPWLFVVGGVGCAYWFHLLWVNRTIGRLRRVDRHSIDRTIISPSPAE